MKYIYLLSVLLIPTLIFSKLPNAKDLELQKKIYTTEVQLKESQEKTFQLTQKIQVEDRWWPSGVWITGIGVDILSLCTIEKAWDNGGPDLLIPPAIFAAGVGLYYLGSYYESKTQKALEPLEQSKSDEETTTEKLERILNKNKQQFHLSQGDRMTIVYNSQGQELFWRAES